MIGIGLVDIFDAEVVNYNTELDFPCCMVPEACCVVVWEVSELYEVLCKAVVRILVGIEGGLTFLCIYWRGRVFY